MAAMLFPIIVGICSLIAVAIFYAGGFAEERRTGGVR
jgi:hypothetical protein